MLMRCHSDPSLSVIPSPSLYVIPSGARNLSLPFGINSARNLTLSLRASSVRNIDFTLRSKQGFLLLVEMTINISAHRNDIGENLV